MSTTTQTTAAFVFKGSLFTLTAIVLLSDDLDAFAEQLPHKLQQAPKFFLHAPVVLELSKLPHPEILDFLRLKALLTHFKLNPLGVRGLNDAASQRAAAAGFAILSDSHATETPHVTAPEAPTEAPPLHSPARIVTQPIRSGQQVYARGGDLIILASVGAGAEVLADGHIHVYGALRGRALAGVNGYMEAHIFCRSLEAELVSVAGHYRVLEDFKESVLKQPVNIALQGEQLLINRLD